MTVEEIQGTVRSVGKLINEIAEGTLQTSSSEDYQENHPSNDELFADIQELVAP